jgi:hypothetical protein
MTTVRDIEDAIRKLSPRDLTELREWFLEFNSAVWDAQFESDVRNGKLDALADQALRDLDQGKCTDL